MKDSVLILLVVLICGAAWGGQTPSVEQGASIEFIGGDIAQLTEGVKLFTDRPFILNTPPDGVRGQQYLRGSIVGPNVFRVNKSGVITILTPESDLHASSQVEALEANGFQRVQQPELFQVFGEDEWNRARIYRKKVQAGEEYRFGKWVIVCGFSSAKKWNSVAWDENQGELLYNGIRLPEVWPPQGIDPREVSPMPVPYLDFPPAVLPIDVGRQLFVDDFLIESTDMERNFHMPRKYEGNPVLEPETPIELGLIEPEGHTKPYGHGNAGAGPKSGGCWWDPDDQLFKLWYETSWFGPIAMAVSRDGLNWERPEFDIRPGTNIVSPIDILPDSWTVVRNWDAATPDEKWTLYVQPPVPALVGTRLTSRDGIHWDSRVETGKAGDRSTHFYNPFRNKWVFSIRAGFPNIGLPSRVRARQYYESDDFMSGEQWAADERVTWAMTDELDLPDPYIGDAAQLYNLDAVAYESIMLGVFEILLGPSNPFCAKQGVPKITELNFAYSRDGFHWDRPDRRAQIPAERKDVWDRGYIQPLGNVCTIVGDQLYFYYIGFRGNTAKADTKNGMYDRSATGVATLRRDGFASMDAGADAALLTTRPVLFSGKYLFVNVDAPQGILRAEVLDAEGNPIEPFTLENCLPITEDSTLEAVNWKDGSDLSVLAGEPVQFRFELMNGSFYAFWVSQDASGRSDGYVAGGGPGYTGPTDTVGRLR